MIMNIENVINRIESRFESVRGRPLKDHATVYTHPDKHNRVQGFAVAEHHSVGGSRKIQLSFGGRTTKKFQQMVLKDLRSRKRGITFGPDL